MAHATRTVKPDPDRHPPGTSSARSIAATVEWVRTAIDGEPATVRILLPDRGGRLRVFATSGEPFAGGRRRSAHRREAFETRRAIHVELSDDRSLEFLPLIVDGSVLGVIEAVAPSRALRERRGVLDAVVGQCAVVVRSVLDKRRSDDELDEQGALLRLAGDLLHADSPTAAVRLTVARCAERVGPPIVGLMPDREGKGWFVAAARGLGTSRRAELRRAASAVRTRGRFASVADRLAARVGAIAGTDGARGILAGDAVLVVRAAREHDAFLRIASAMLRDVLDRLGPTGWAQVRDEDLNLAIATTAHELKEPLVGVRAALDRIAAADGDPGGRELLHRSRGELDRMADLVDPLLRWAAGTGELSLRRTDLVRLVDEAVASCSLASDGNRVDVRAAEPVWLEIDPIELRAAITNVVRNALAYSPPRSAVTVTVTSSYEGVTITIRDRGPGVSAVEGDRIFDPFARGRVGASTRGGTGLGLFIARRAIEAHGGSIAFRPVRTGAEFSIELPASHDRRSRSAS